MRAALGTQTATGAWARRGWVLATLALVASTLVLVATPERAGATTTITVTTTTDTAADDGLCSIREAITAANTDTASGALSGECPAGSGADTIVLNGSTYTLTNGLPEIYTDLSITGNGSTIHSTAANASVVEVGGVATVTIADITLTGGNANFGGGIDNHNGLLTVLNSTIASNTASFGGGIYNRAGTLTVLNSTITGNFAGDGAGIYNDDGGATSILNSTITGNTATDTGGGIGNRNSRVDVAYSTITDNSAPDGAGIWSYGDTVTFTTVEFSIVAGNTGSGKDIEIEPVGGFDGYTSGGYNILGTFDATIDEFPGIGDLTGQTPLLGPLADNGGSTQTHALLAGSPAIDHVTLTTPNQPALDQRGNSRPQGLALDAGAYEADACINTIYTVATQQELHAAVDCYNAATTGAYTINVTGDITYTGPTIAILNNTTATLAMNGNGNTLDANGNSRVVYVAAGTVTIAGITITDGDTTSGGGLYIANGGDVTLTGSTISGNTATDGGGIYNLGTLTVLNSTISGNTATTSGGGIRNNDDTVVVAYSTITNNTAPDGAGIWSYNDSVTFTTVEASIVAGNSGGGNDLDIRSNAGTDSYTSAGYNILGTTGTAINAFGAGNNDLTGQNPLLGALADNGGGGDTHLLQTGSPAIDHVTGATPNQPTLDQRGATRPQGPAHDAGAFERGPCEYNAYDVATQLELDAAIDCYNAATTGAYTINVTNNITYSEPSTRINNTTTATLTIQGNDNTLDANSNLHVVYVIAGTVTIDNTTLTGGRVITGEGAGIHNIDGTLTLLNSTIAGNTASTGGGIYNRDGALTVTGSTITGNTASYGAGMYNAGTLTVLNSTISGNSASAWGGGIYNWNASATVAYSTITNNTAPDGAGISSLNHAATSTTIEASIVAGNTGGGNDLDITTNTGADSYTSAGYNILGITGTAINAFGVGGNDLTGQNPLLGALADNGGSTETHTLLLGSPAIDHVTGATANQPALDQRGTTRPLGLPLDAGALELGLCEATAYNAANQPELNAAIDCYNSATTGAYTINLTGDIAYTGATTPINNSATATLTIQGNGNTVDANGNNGSVLLIITGAVTVANTTLTGGDAFSGGGISTLSGELTVTGSTITGNTSSLGGGIYNAGTLTVLNSSISANIATTGGGIRNDDTVTVAYSTITNNTAPDGAGIWSFNDTGTSTTIEASIVAGNTGGGNDLDILFNAGTDSYTSAGYNILGTMGTAINAFGAGSNDLTGQNPLLGALADNGGSTETHALLTGSPAVDHVTGATANQPALDQRAVPRPEGTAHDAGAFELEFAACTNATYSVSAQPELNAAIACYNAATTGAYTINATGNITYTGPITAINNTTTATLTIKGDGNTLDANGNGRVVPIAAGTVTIDNTTLAGGNENAGGGIFNSNDGTLTVLNSTITGNTASFGGGILNTGTLTVLNSTITGNNASTLGGGIYTGNESATIAYSTITNNTAPDGAGILSFNTAATSTTIEASIVAGNTGGGNDLDINTNAGTDSYTSAGYNILGTTGTAINAFGAGNNDLTGQNPLLGPLTDNGGSTQTHALLPGSPAIDHVTGATPSQPALDQRGNNRPQGLAHDAGAYEADACINSAYSVATQPELNAAITCYNAATTGAHSINATNSITYTGPITAIDNSTTATLTIQGNGNTFDANGNNNVVDVDAGTVTITDTTLTGGNTIFGGGISNSGGTLTVLNSTITGNTASYGGGIYNNSGTLTVLNSTITGNAATTAGGGIRNNDDTVVVAYSTITNNTAPNGAGIWSYNDTVTFTTVEASIVAGNTGGGSDIHINTNAGTDSYISAGYNVLGTIGTAINAFGAGSNDLTGQTPLLGPLADNGGLTHTHALLPGSPAIDHVTGTTTNQPTLDQRDEARPQGAARDAGAYEAGPCEAINYDVSTQPELNAAIDCYNTATTGAYTINATGNITYTGPITPINNSTTATLTIQGNGHTLDANGNNNVVFVAAGTVTINDTTLTGGNATSGGGISNVGTLDVHNSTITDNTATNGGGIYNEGTLTATNSTISGNAATYGGGLFNFVGGATTILNSTISGNTATTSAGGILAYATVVVAYSTVTDNTGPGAAGIRSSGDASTSTSVSASVVADNVGSDVGIFNGVTNSFVSGGYNVVGTGDASGVFVGAGDEVIGTVGAGLGPLADNGGPTFTHLPGALSTVVDHVSSAPTNLFGVPDPSTGQRGEARPAGLFKDAGSVEVAVVVPVGLCNGKVPTLVVPPGGVDFFGTTGDDVILGTPGVDRIFGLGGNDDICGEADGAIVGGDDNLNGGNGLDTIFGGPGNDFVGGQGGVDQLFGGDGDDEIAGGIGDDVMRGGDGEDVLRGQGGADQIFGEGDVDTIFGGSGNDVIETGPGGNLGTAHVVTGNGNNDTITGSPDADLLDGQNGLDIIFGEGGDDTLTGGLGFDRLNGGDGNDTLEGFGSRDILHGDGDDDIVNGGAGDDDLYGDAGANDECNGGPGTDATPTGNGCEAITGIP